MMLGRPPRLKQRQSEVHAFNLRWQVRQLTITISGMNWFPMATKVASLNKKTVSHFQDGRRLAMEGRRGVWLAGPIFVPS